MTDPATPDSARHKLLRLINVSEKLSSDFSPLIDQTQCPTLCIAYTNGILIVHDIETHRSSII